MGSEGLYLEHKWFIERAITIVSRRQRLPASEAEEFAAEARLRFVLDDYAILRRFEGRSSIGTYLNTVVTHLFQDWRNARLGKWRSSAEAKRLGPVAIDLERLMVRDGMSFDQAFETLRSRPGFTESRQHCEALATRFPSRTGRRHFVSDELLADVAGAHEADRGVQAKEAAAAAERAVRELDDAVRRLPPQDRLILRMRFEDGVRVAEIARVLQLEAKPLYARIQRMLADLRGILEAAGFTASAAAEVFATGGLDLRADDSETMTEPDSHVRPFPGVPRSSAAGGTR